MVYIIAEAGVNHNGKLDFISIHDGARIEIIFN